MTSLSITYSNQDRHDGAEELQVVVVERWKRLLGPDHPDTLDAQSRHMDSNFFMSDICTTRSIHLHFITFKFHGYAVSTIEIFSSLPESEA